MTTPQLPMANGHAPPFLVWPVSRREFFRALWVAMLMAVAWGMLIYGVRTLIMLGSSVVAGAVMHTFLKKVIKWKRADCLLFSHTLLSSMLLVALARPTWPAWIVAATALLLPLVFTLLGGPGRERVHIAIAAVLVIQYVVLPRLEGHTYTDKTDAVLARDRLFMGDIRDQHRPVAGSGIEGGDMLGAWPASRDLKGYDATPTVPPAVIAADALNQVSSVLLSRGADLSTPLQPSQARDIQRILERAFAFDLPSMDLFMLGVSPNRVGAASLIAITLAGIFLAYRYILRPRTVLMFLLMYILATVAFAFTPHVVNSVGLPVLWSVFKKFPGEIITLIQFLLLNSDAPFVAVFVLALPGAEPLTPRGRRIYLVVAAILAAGLHRLDPAAPAATLILCLFTPLAPFFDRVFATRSWLSGAR